MQRCGALASSLPGVKAIPNARVCSRSAHTPKPMALPSATTFGPLIPIKNPQRLSSFIPRAVNAAAAKEGWWLKELPANFAHVHDVQQLVDQLAEAAKQDQLLVVDFFAPWCAACKALFPKLKKICVENPDVRFVAINFDEGKSICRQLGVKVLPYFQFYRGAEGRVAGFPASISKVAKIKEAIADFKSERCFLEEVPAAPLAEYPDVLPTSNGIIVANGVKAGSEDESEETRKAELVV